MDFNRQLPPSAKPGRNSRQAITHSSSAFIRRNFDSEDIGDEGRIQGFQVAQRSDLASSQRRNSLKKPRSPVSKLQHRPSSPKIKGQMEDLRKLSPSSKKKKRPTYVREQQDELMADPISSFNESDKDPSEALNLQCLEILRSSGIEMHPKQQQELLQSKQMQQLLLMMGKKEHSQAVITDLIQKASKTQTNIASALASATSALLKGNQESLLSLGAKRHSTPTIGSLSPTQMKKNREFQQILMANSPSHKQQSMELESESNTPSKSSKSQTSSTKKTRKQRQLEAVSNLNKPTYSSKMKEVVSPAKHSRGPDSPLKRSLRKGDVSTLQEESSTKKKLFKTERSSLLKKDNRSTLFGDMDESPSFRSRANQLSRPEESMEPSLAEKMKQMSVYDLYQMTQMVNQGGQQPTANVLIDAFLRQQQLSTSQHPLGSIPQSEAGTIQPFQGGTETNIDLRIPNQPGVAPQVSQVSHMSRHTDSLVEIAPTRNSMHFQSHSQLTSEKKQDLFGAGPITIDIDKIFSEAADQSMEQAPKEEQKEVQGPAIAFSPQFCQAQNRSSINQQLQEEISSMPPESEQEEGPIDRGSSLRESYEKFKERLKKKQDDFTPQPQPESPPRHKSPPKGTPPLPTSKKGNYLNNINKRYVSKRAGSQGKTSSPGSNREADRAHMSLATFGHDASTSGPPVESLKNSPSKTRFQTKVKSIPPPKLPVKETGPHQKKESLELTPQGSKELGERGSAIRENFNEFKKHFARSSNRNSMVDNRSDVPAPESEVTSEMRTPVVSTRLNIVNLSKSDNVKDYSESPPPKSQGSKSGDLIRRSRKKRSTDMRKSQNEWLTKSNRMSVPSYKAADSCGGDIPQNIELNEKPPPVTPFEVPSKPHVNQFEALVEQCLSKSQSRMQSRQMVESQISAHQEPIGQEDEIGSKPKAHTKLQGGKKIDRILGFKTPLKPSSSQTQPYSPILKSKQRQTDIMEMRMVSGGVNSQQFTSNTASKRSKKAKSLLKSKPAPQSKGQAPLVLNSMPSDKDNDSDKQLEILEEKADKLSSFLPDTQNNYLMHLPSRPLNCSGIESSDGVVDISIPASATKAGFSRQQSERESRRESLHSSRQPSMGHNTLMDMISQKSEPAAARPAKKTMKGSKSASKFGTKSRPQGLLPSKMANSSSKKSVIMTQMPSTRLTVLAKQYYQNENKKAPSKPDKNSKLDNELKQLRLLLKGALDKFTVTSIRDLEAVKKPQRYQFFISKLFRIFTDLVFQIEQHANDENKDLAEEIESERFGQFVRVQGKLFMQAEIELKKFHYQFLQEAQRSKEPGFNSHFDREIQEEWSFQVKPALYSPTPAFIFKIQSLPKKLKRLIEANSLSEQQAYVAQERKSSALQCLASIQRFVLKINEILTGNQSHSNMCIKASKSGMLFGRMFEAIKFATAYTTKKCQKEIDRVKQAPTYAADRYDQQSSGSDATPLAFDRTMKAINHPGLELNNQATSETNIQPFTPQSKHDYLQKEIEQEVQTMKQNFMKEGKHLESSEDEQVNYGNLHPSDVLFGRTQTQVFDYKSKTIESLQLENPADSEALTFHINLIKCNEKSSGGTITDQALSSRRSRTSRNSSRKPETRHSSKLRLGKVSATTPRVNEYSEDLKVKPEKTEAVVAPQIISNTVQVLEQEEAKDEGMRKTMLQGDGEQHILEEPADNIFSFDKHQFDAQNSNQPDSLLPQSQPVSDHGLSFEQNADVDGSRSDHRSEEVIEIDPIAALRSASTPGNLSSLQPISCEEDEERADQFMKPNESQAPLPNNMLLEEQNEPKPARQEMDNEDEFSLVDEVNTEEDKEETVTAVTTTAQAEEIIPRDQNAVTFGLNTKVQTPSGRKPFDPLDKSDDEAPDPLEEIPMPISQIEMSVSNSGSKMEVTAIEEAKGDNAFQAQIEELHEEMNFLEDERASFWADYQEPTFIPVVAAPSKKKTGKAKKKRAVDYGAFHPETGIPLFRFYPEFEEEGFRILPSKIFCRRQDDLKQRKANDFNKHVEAIAGKPTPDRRQRRRIVRH